MLKILVTGGAGFIGSAMVRHIIRDTQDAVINLDKLTYAGNLESLADVSTSERYAFEQVDIELIYAGRTLGMSERKIFWRVVLPSAGPGVASGTILTFARALGEYGATSMLAGNIAGKTGTAETSQGRDHGWFVAYGPFDNPNIVVAVIVEQGGFGSQSAVPIGREILEAAFHVGRYAPDAQQDAAAGK